MRLLNKSKADKLVPWSSFQPGNLPELMSHHVSPAISKLNFSDKSSTEYFSLWIFLSHRTWKWSDSPHIGWAFSSKAPPAVVIYGTITSVWMWAFLFLKAVVWIQAAAKPLHGFHSSPYPLTTGLSFLPKTNCTMLLFNSPASLSYDLGDQSLDLRHWEVSFSLLRMACAKP